MCSTYITLILYLTEGYCDPHGGCQSSWHLTITAPWWVRNSFEFQEEEAMHWGSLGLSYLLDLFSGRAHPCGKVFSTRVLRVERHLKRVTFRVFTEGRWNRFCDRTPVFLKLGRQEQGLVKTMHKPSLCGTSAACESLELLVSHLSCLWVTWAACEVLLPQGERQQGQSEDF